MKNSPSNDAFDAALRRDAARAREGVTPSSDLESRILREVHHSRAEVAASIKPSRRWLLPLVSLSAAGACAVLAVVLLQKPTAPSDPVVPSHTAAATTESELNPSGTTPNLLRALQPQAMALLAEDPLQTEVNAVVADARSALQFLALNFLPTETESQQPRSG